MMSRGGCRLARKRFLALEEGVLGAEEAGEVRAHLASCAACRREWEGWQADGRLLREAMRPARAPRDIAAAALAGIRHGAVPGRFGRWRLAIGWRAAGAVAAAAAVLLVAGVWALSSGGYQRVGAVDGSVGRPMAQQRGARFASALDPGALVYTGCRLLTGPEEEASVRFDDGSRLVLKEGAEATLDCVGEASAPRAHGLPHVCLHQGEVLVDLKSVRFFRAVGTPMGSAIVIGTTFRIRMKCVFRVRTVLEVLEGEAEFSCPGGEVRALPGSVWAVDAGSGRPRRVSGADWAK